MKNKSSLISFLFKTSYVYGSNLNLVCEMMFESDRTKYCKSFLTRTHGKESVRLLINYGTYLIYDFGKNTS